MLNAIARYQHAISECELKAQHAQHHEIQQLWTTIGAAWLFLLQREERLAAEEAERADP